MNSRLKDYTGQRFGRWTLLSYIGPASGTRMWLCRCDCGTERSVSLGNLKMGRSRSCGCLQEEVASQTKFKHGQVNHQIYRTWAGIKNRCYNENDQDFKYYGGRGIKVSDWWLADFWNFWDDIARGWRPGLTIDRIDVNGHYEPGNCRWITIEDQQKNKRPLKNY